jgi:2-(3-amino-3-carboxypropyl)histidine synthase
MDKMVKGYDFNYDFEINKIVKEIKKQKAHNVLIQLPEGLKPQALRIVNEIEKKTNADCHVWLGSCYGACDIPDLGNIKIDLLVQFGHTPL